jgi:hypothetical protein
MADKFYEVRLRVKVAADGLPDAQEKANEIVLYLNEMTHKAQDRKNGSVFGSVWTTGVVEVIPTHEEVEKTDPYDKPLDPPLGYSDGGYRG